MNNYYTSETLIEIFEKKKKTETQKKTKKKETTFVFVMIIKSVFFIFVEENKSFCFLNQTSIGVCS